MRRARHAVAAAHRVGPRDLRALERARSAVGVDLDDLRDEVPRWPLAAPAANLALNAFESARRDARAFCGSLVPGAGARAGAHCCFWLELVWSVFVSRSSDSPPWLRDLLLVEQQAGRR